MKYGSFALVASFATTIVALPHVVERDVVVVTKTDIHVDQVEVTKFVTAGAPDATTAVTVTAAAPSSSAAEQHEHHPHGQNHWSISHSDSASAAPVVISTTAPAPAPPAPTTTTPATTAVPVTTPKVTTSADAPKAPAANNPGSKTGGMTYTAPINPYPTPSSVTTDGDESYNPFDGNMQVNSLNVHNELRKKYGANPVVWNYTLEQDVIDVNTNKYGSECLFQHQPGDFGQNIAAMTGGSVASQFGMWADEVKDVNFNGGENGRTSAGHFTQVVWKDTTSIACGAVKCGDGGSQVNSDHRNATGYPDAWKGWFYMCNYYPAGNVGGEYVANVVAS